MRVTRGLGVCGTEKFHKNSISHYEQKLLFIFEVIIKCFHEKKERIQNGHKFFSQTNLIG